MSASDLDPAAGVTPSIDWNRLHLNSFAIRTREIVAFLSENELYLICLDIGGQFGTNCNGGAVCRISFSNG